MAAVDATAEAERVRELMAHRPDEVQVRRPGAQQEAGAQVIDDLAQACLDVVARVEREQITDGRACRLR